MTTTNASDSAVAPDEEQRRETIQEFVDSRDTRVRLDRAANVLQGVKLLGLASRNGRRYRESALRRAIPLYEGAKVNVNHPQGDPLSPRDYRDRIGVIRSVRLRPGEGLFGALHFNPKHPLAEQLVWDAEHAPENVGLSHNVLARTGREAGRIVVESIEKVQSVDLVADPATTSGLFEQASSSRTDSGEGEPSPDWDALTLHQLELHRPDLLAELAETHQQQLAERQRQIDELTDREAAARRRVRIAELLTEHGLPLPGDADPIAAKITSQAFLESLAAAADEVALERLIADRAQAVGEAAAPRSRIVAREQQLATAPETPAPADSAGFVAAITST